MLGQEGGQSKGSSPDAPLWSDGPPFEASEEAEAVTVAAATCLIAASRRAGLEKSKVPLATMDCGGKTSTGLKPVVDGNWVQSPTELEEVELEEEYVELVVTNHLGGRKVSPPIPESTLSIP